eukprot:1839941-Pleurochrysis_carterae.AAC.1
MLSASHDDSSTPGCYSESAHEMAARLYMKTYPDVECLVAQAESEYPSIGPTARSNLRPMER